MAPDEVASLPVPAAVEGMEIRVVGTRHHTMITKGVEKQYRYVDQA